MCTPVHAPGPPFLLLCLPNSYLNSLVEHCSHINQWIATAWTSTWTFMWTLVFVTSHWTTKPLLLLQLLPEVLSTCSLCLINVWKCIKEGVMGCLKTHNKILMIVCKLKRHQNSRDVTSFCASHRSIPRPKQWVQSKSSMNSLRLSFLTSQLLLMFF